MISMTTLIKWCALIEKLTRRLSELAAKNRRIDMTSILERLKKTIDRLERVKRIEKRTQSANTWANIAQDLSSIAQATIKMNVKQAPPKRRLTREMKLMMWIKGKQETKRVHKMSATKVMTLTRDSNIVNTLNARKNIQEIRCFKGMVVFKMRSESNRKILKSNNFWVKNVSIATILRRKRAKMMMHDIRVKGMSKNMKEERAKTMKRSCKIMHQELKIEEMTWLTKKSDKKKYFFIMI